ncbi:MAG: ribonuclease P protein component [Candidatus Brennerbacteria bacterium]|nr:ribonuclease P protein component [Candidatus Brennerbacteria bacterium]
MQSTIPLVTIRRGVRGTKKSLVIAVTKKEAPRAVLRNRIRRRIRVACARITFAPAGAITIVGFKGVAQAPFAALVEEIEKKLRLYG